MNEKDIALINLLSPEAQAAVLHYARFLASVNGAKPAKETPEQKAAKQAAAEKAAAEQAQRDEKDRQELQRIQRYIDKTEIPPEIHSRYGLLCTEARALLSIADTGKMLLAAFKFGQAKGYRARRTSAQVRASRATTGKKEN